MFIFEFVKFSFTNIEICKKDKWMNAQRQIVAGSGCSLSLGVITSVISIVLNLITILLLIFGDRRNKLSRNVSNDMMPLNTNLERNCKAEDHTKPAFERNASDEEKDGNSLMKRQNTGSSKSQQYNKMEGHYGDSDVMDSSYIAIYREGIISKDDIW